MGKTSLLGIAFYYGASPGTVEVCLEPSVRACVPSHGCRAYEPTSEEPRMSRRSRRRQSWDSENRSKHKLHFQVKLSA